MKDPLAVLPAATIGFHMPEIGSDDYYALSLLGIILSYGESSRLYRRLVYESNWVTSVSAGPNQYKGPELFNLWLQVQSGVEVQKVLDAVNDELSKVNENSISDQELEKAKNQIAFAFVNRLATVSGVGEWLARYAVYFGDPHMINKELSRFLSITTRDITESAQRSFYPENRTLIQVEPGTR